MAKRLKEAKQFIDEINMDNIDPDMEDGKMSLKKMSEILHKEEADLRQISSASLLGKLEGRDVPYRIRTEVRPATKRWQLLYADAYHRQKIDESGKYRSASPSPTYHEKITESPLLVHELRVSHRCWCTSYEFHYGVRYDIRGGKAKQLPVATPSSCSGLKVLRPKVANRGEWGGAGRGRRREGGRGSEGREEREWGGGRSESGGPAHLRHESITPCDTIIPLICDTSDTVTRAPTWVTRENHGITAVGARCCTCYDSPRDWERGNPEPGSPICSHNFLSLGSSHPPFPPTPHSRTKNTKSSVETSALSCTTFPRRALGAVSPFSARALQCAYTLVPD